MRLELKPVYDARRSFYGKAFIEFNEHNNFNKYYILFSYNVPVLTISKYYIHFTAKPEQYTNTTMRHIRELLRQYADAPREAWALNDKNKIYNISKRDIFKYGIKTKNDYKMRNTMTARTDTRQKAIKELNK